MITMQFPRSQVSIAAFFSCLTLGCGTQIGNPTGSGIARVTDHPATLNTLVNAAFLQTVDGMNMGDYAYSRLESRVSTDRTCQSHTGARISLLDKAETRHSVVDDSPAWLARSDLSIKRSYEDAWTQNGVLLACDPSIRAIRFNYERLQMGPVRLESQVTEDMDRRLQLTAKGENQVLESTLTFHKSGRRTLDFTNYAELGRNVILDAQLRNQVESTLTLPTSGADTDSATPSTIVLQLQDRFPLDFTITLDNNQQWTRYDIASGRQEFLIPSSGEVLRLEFRNVTFTRTAGCIPVSGQLTATVLRPNESAQRYSLSFQRNASLVMKREGGVENLVLAPFACVLKER
jgi:hypothetical protein